MGTKPKMLPRAILQLAEWRKQQQQEIEERNSAMVALLASRVPKNLKTWLENGGVSFIRDLVEHGRAMRKYSRSEENQTEYGYTNLEEFETRLMQLNTAWLPVAKLEILWEGQRRFEVVFTAT